MVFYRHAICVISVEIGCKLINHPCYFCLQSQLLKSEICCWCWIVGFPIALDDYELSRLLTMGKKHRCVWLTVDYIHQDRYSYYSIYSGVYGPFWWQSPLSHLVFGEFILGKQKVSCLALCILTVHKCVNISADYTNICGLCSNFELSQWLSSIKRSKVLPQPSPSDEILLDLADFPCWIKI